MGETSKIEKHHLPPAGDQASLERRFNQGGSGGNTRPSQQQFNAPSLNQNTYYQTQTSAGGTAI
jgi:hypothetical protein